MVPGQYRKYLAYFQVIYLICLRIAIKVPWYVPNKRFHDDLQIKIKITKTTTIVYKEIATVNYNPYVF